MAARDSLLTDVFSLDAAAAVLRSAFGVDRVSIARYTPDGSLFRIVGCNGKLLFSPGLEAPAALSSQMLAAASGSIFVEADFERAACWHRAVDELMCALGFRGGCSLPVACHDGSCGAVSLSTTESGRSLDRCVDAIVPMLDDVSALLEGSRRIRLSGREQDVLRDLDEGLRFKEIARRHGIREATVKGYARTLFVKLGAHSRTEAVNCARDLGLLGQMRPR